MPDRSKYSSARLMDKASLYARVNINDINANLRANGTRKIYQGIERKLNSRGEKTYIPVTV